jgi:hypothetical protein
MKNAPKPVGRICRGASIVDNIKAFNESPAAQAAIAVLKISKTSSCARCKKLEHREGVGNVFNSVMVLGAPRFSLPGHFDAAGDLCAGKIYLGQDPISRFSGQG